MLSNVLIITLAVITFAAGCLATYVTWGLAREPDDNLGIGAAISFVTGTAASLCFFLFVIAIFALITK